MARLTGLPRKIVAVHRALRAAGFAHAFGGALALAWCTERGARHHRHRRERVRPRDRADDVVAALPRGVHATPEQLAALERDGQVRLFWDTTPVDLFLDTTEFHEQAAARARWEDFGGEQLPFLSCSDLAVFKAFFDRTKDWADLEEMAAIGALDVDRVLGLLVRYLGPDDHRIERLSVTLA